MSRRIDALIAEHIFDTEVRKETYSNEIYFTEKYIQADGSILPHYSTDIAAAWLVVESLKLGIQPSYCGNWFSWPHMEKLEGVIADTAPLAICLAALKAKGIDTEDLN